MNPESIFIDTNILVYANLTYSPYYAQAVQHLQNLDAQNVPLWISPQILREYLSAMTKPGILTETIPIASLVADIRYFSSRFFMAEDNTLVREKLLDLIQHVPMGGARIHDGNIVATMQAYGIQHILTHNVSDFTRFEKCIQIVPLV